MTLGDRHVDHVTAGAPNFVLSGVHLVDRRRFASGSPSRWKRYGTGCTARDISQSLPARPFLANSQAMQRASPRRFRQKVRWSSARQRTTPESLGRFVGPSPRAWSISVLRATAISLLEFQGIAPFGALEYVCSRRRANSGNASRGKWLMPAASALPPPVMNWRHRASAPVRTAAGARTLTVYPP